MPRSGQHTSASGCPTSFAKRCTATWSGSQRRRMCWRGTRSPSPTQSSRLATWPIGDRPRSGRIGAMRRGEVWFAATPGGDRPVLVLTRDPVADRIESVVVAALTRTKRYLVSELELTAEADGVPSDCVVNFDNIHTVNKTTFRRLVTTLSGPRMAQAC